MTLKQHMAFTEIREALQGAVTTDGYSYASISYERNKEHGYLTVSICFEKVYHFSFTGDHVSRANCLIFIDENGVAEWIDTSKEGCPFVRIVRRNGKPSLRRALRSYFLDLAA